MDSIEMAAAENYGIIVSHKNESNIRLPEIKLQTGKDLRTK